MRLGHALHSLLKPDTGRFLLPVVAFACVYYLWLLERPTPQPLFNNNALGNTLVVASTRGDDTRWIHEYFSDWDTRIYVADDRSAPLTVEKNKGREAAVYLTYIIDNYHNLPNVSVLFHGRRWQWHNDDPMYDGVPMIQNLRLEHVRSAGYVNLRCVQTLGCPAEIVPQDPSNPRDEKLQTEIDFSKAWLELFPGVELPRVVGVPCCSQMALSKEVILQRSREDYLRYRKWLWDTELPDRTSGRIFEYTWHIIFGKPAVYCPPAGDCYCRNFGHCNLKCTAERCENRYQLPPSALIPDGWPEHGTGERGWPEKNWWRKGDKNH